MREAAGPEEMFVSIDVETAGATPGAYALLSIGACLVDDPDVTFYAELKPDRDAVDPEALAVGGLSMDELLASGEEPAVALPRFADWVDEVCAGRKPVFVGFNAAFDWMFVADYLARYAGRNPFGHAALDVKAYAMGRTGSTWAETSMRFLGPRYLGDGHGLSHHALADAQDQAALFRALIDTGAPDERPGPDQR